MKSLKRLLLLVIFAALLLTIGCFGNPVKIDPVAQKPIDDTKGRTMSSEACGFQLLQLVPFMINDRYERAYEKLRKEANGDHITDLKMRERWFFMLIGTGHCTEMEATAYPYKM